MQQSDIIQNKEIHRKIIKTVVYFDTSKKRNNFTIFVVVLEYRYK